MKVMVIVMVNEGKQFEKDFANSIPAYCYCHRLRDSTQSFYKAQETSYSWDNECDFFVFNNTSQFFYAIECKSTKSRSMSFQRNKEDAKKRPNQMIKYHQVESLTKMSKYNHIKTGLLLNFRDDKNDMQRTYWIDIRNYNNLIANTTKSSINEIDIIKYNAIKLIGQKKRVHYKWDVENLFIILESNANKKGRCI